MRTAKFLAIAVVSVPLLGLAATVAHSGVKVGEAVFAFRPTHVTGPDKGSQTCPVCKYGMTPAAQIWVNGDNMDNVGKLAKALESRISKAGSAKFKTFFVFVSPKVKAQLPAIAAKYGLKNVALTYVQGPKDEAIGEYAINVAPTIKNTVMVYANRQVVANMVNLQADASGLKSLNGAVDKALSQGH